MSTAALQEKIGSAKRLSRKLSGEILEFFCGHTTSEGWDFWEWFMTAHRKVALRWYTEQERKVVVVSFMVFHANGLDWPKAHLDSKGRESFRKNSRCVPIVSTLPPCRGFRKKGLWNNWIVPGLDVRDRILAKN